MKLLSNQMGNNINQHATTMLQGLTGMMDELKKKQREFLDNATPAQKADYAKRMKEMGAADKIKDLQEQLKEVTKDL